MERKPFRVVGHFCFENEKKDRDGKPYIKRDFGLEVCTEMGCAPASVYINDEEANHHKKVTGNGFTWDELREQPFKPYDATGDFNIIQVTDVKRAKHEKQRDKAVGRFAVRVTNVEIRKAA
ncbi:hypothetical protein [Botrimarina mediterranea]|uniref:hypothetical protein n=1 Tax=Botrimarina mediterranea TaxID=2528022 RepID=UPI00118B3B1F|nr:hypothetical protein K2D_12810 [Planctomycetes bacterium K2D]